MQIGDLLVHRECLLRPAIRLVSGLILLWELVILNLLFFFVLLLFSVLLLRVDSVTKLVSLRSNQGNARIFFLYFTIYEYIEELNMSV